MEVDSQLAMLNLLECVLIINGKTWNFVYNADYIRALGWSLHLALPKAIVCELSDDQSQRASRIYVSLEYLQIV